jgi:hypothetical protein
MVRKSRRAHSRKMKHHSRKHKTHRRHRTHRRRGGMAPVSYHLSGSWPSRMSLGQGADYFKYHEGQHGGMAPIADIGKTLPAELRGPAHIGGIDKAIADVRGLRDEPDYMVAAPAKVGGRRHKRKAHKKSHKRSHRRSRHHKRRSMRRRGGALGYAPFPSSGMLLSSSSAYAQAGLNPEWKTDVAFTDAKIRDTQ